jgi:hypothetical protein
MGPEPEDLPAILEKIKAGLPEATSNPATPEAAQAPSGG